MVIWVPIIYCECIVRAKGFAAYKMSKKVLSFVLVLYLVTGDFH